MSSFLEMRNFKERERGRMSALESAWRGSYNPEPLLASILLLRCALLANGQFALRSRASFEKVRGMCRNTTGALASVYDRAWREAYRHKWIESEKHGCDLGYCAIQDWSRRHFKRFVRWCHWLHLTGRQRFQEFESKFFGTVSDPHDDLESHIIRLFWDGQENLEIYCSAHGSGWPLERVFHLLLSLDINGARLSPLVA